MPRSRFHNPSRRDVLKTGALAGVGLALGRLNVAAAPQASSLPLITKPIPSTGERLPVVGLGTNAYGRAQTPEELAPLREVLRRLPELGGKVVDTAPSYGRSEEVIGQLVAEIGNRAQLFLATKVTAPGGEAAKGVAMMEESFRRLRTDRVDLMQVHNLNGVDVLMPVLREWKQAGRIRYIGITTSSDAQYPQMIEFMKKYDLDFIQVDYSIGNRGAGDAILPLARDRGMAVLLNVPFGGRGGRNLLRTVADRPLPDWAKEFDAETWAQFFLKYAVSHPAVTCAIPGTTQAAHLEDNLRGARGRLPDEAMRRKMEQFWDSLAQ
jgi:aryl-alcohol dehydrogenase-like predicted oxidoreductase